MRGKTAAALLVAIGVMGATSAISYAGEAGIDGDGNFLTFDADISPPVAGTKAKPRPVTLTVHQMFGNYRNGKQPPRSTTLAVRLPKGMTTNAGMFEACPLPKSDADIKVSRCSAESQVGTGTALADARNLGVNDPVPATVTAFNGEKNAAGNYTFILFGEADVAGTKVTTEYDFEMKKGGAGFGNQLVTFDPYSSPPPDPNAGYITLNRLDLKVGRTVKSKVPGHKVVTHGYEEAPTSCPKKGWAFREEFTLVTGSTLLAPDFVACTK
jgi:hypothetical protein